MGEQRVVGRWSRVHGEGWNVRRCDTQFSLTLHTHTHTHSVHTVAGCWVVVRRLLGGKMSQVSCIAWCGMGVTYRIFFGGGEREGWREGIM